MTRPPARRSFLRLVLAVACGAGAPAFAHWNPPPAAPLVHVDVYDRTGATPLPVYAKDGRSYVVGQPGHEYAIRIRNLTGARVLAVTSVDGVNVVTGETASPDQSGYVIEPWGSVEIAGWRKNLQRTAAFYFAEHSQSYAARTGRPFDVDVIGVAAFAERRAPIPRVSLGEARREAAPMAKDEAQASAAAPPAAAAEAPALQERADREGSRQQPQAKLGTGHGRSETSHAWRTTFERATAEPAQIVAVHYDRRENLVAQGVIAETPRLARTPRPFPGIRFVPDPH